MAKKRRLKKSVRRLFLIFFVVFWCFITFFVVQSFRKNDLKKAAPAPTEYPIDYHLTGDSLLDSLYFFSRFDSRILDVIDRKSEYPEILLKMFTRNYDMKDYILGYLENKGKVSESISVSSSGIPLFLQYDVRWGYGIYGDQVIAINGCGPTSLAMVIVGLTGRSDVNPSTVSKFAYENGYYQNGGTSWNLFTKGVESFGISGQVLPLSKQKMISELEKGHPIICSMKPGDFTTTGHLLVLTGVENGEFIIHDPNSKLRSSKRWSYEVIAPQIKNLWSFQAI